VSPDPRLYKDAVGEALGLEERKFMDLLDSLRAAGSMSTDRVIADALQLRRNQPELAREFDERVREAEENPARGTRSGRPSYTAWWPADRLDLDPLAFELIWKRTTIEPLRQAFIQRAARTNAANVDRILALARAEGLAWCSALVTTAWGNEAEQDRITPMIVALHKQWRTQAQTDAGAVVALSSFGGKKQLEALKQIREFEREHCKGQTVPPWSDPDAPRLWAEKSVALGESLRQLQMAEARKDPESAQAGLRESSEALKRQVAALELRKGSRYIWNELAAKIGELESKFGQDGATKVGEPTKSSPTLPSVP
jgi:hypothetical protein